MRLLHVEALFFCVAWAALAFAGAVYGSWWVGVLLSVGLLVLVSAASMQVMAQTGDPTGTGTGGSGQKLKAEFNKEPHTRGAVSMARAQSPDSADSQFFICFDDASFLDQQYTVWGRVTEGMDNVDKINRGEPPSNPDKIVSVRVASDIKA